MEHVRKDFVYNGDIPETRSHCCSSTGGGLLGPITCIPVTHSENTKNLVGNTSYILSIFSEFPKISLILPEIRIEQRSLSEI